METPGPDTIAALATPAGRGSVGVIRVSGPDVPRLAGELLGRMPSPRVARLMRFLDADGTILDHGLVLYFPAPASFTGEHVLELQGHGGPLVLDLVLQRLFRLGSRPARPGEFSERAFLNGKMDVAQAEAVADLIDAGTAAAARAAVRSMQGDFSARIHLLQALITELRTQVEAAIDFPDEALDFLPSDAFRDRLSRVFDAFDSIGAAARQGALLREGITVVIAGRPNAGKSSLLNRLVGDDVAIVTDRPGTTRDLNRQHLELDGLPVNLVDTAGLRAASDVVEQEGIRRARIEMHRADRILFVMDASFAPDGSAAPDTHVPPRPAELDGLPAHVPVTLVMNKIDLLGTGPRWIEEGGTTRIDVSALTGEGLDLVRQHLRQGAGYQNLGSGALSARRRHLDALARAREYVRAAAETLTVTQATELFAEDLRLAQRCLGEITGEFTSDELLGEIFSSFCIGK
jgi:tRNA modification GTPase